MSRTDTALKPFVENSSSATVRIASRRFGLRAVASGVEGLGIIFVLSYKKSGQVNNNRGRWYGRRLGPCDAINDKAIKQRRARASRLVADRVRGRMHRP